MSDRPRCCCRYGAAVSGEWPEFECDECPVHQQAFGPSGHTCKRHAKTTTDHGFHSMRGH